MYNQALKLKEIFVELFLIALALSMDSAALSIANGAKNPNLSFKSAFRISSFYAFFQGFMPFLSFIGTEFVSKFIEPYAKIIVFFDFW